MHFTYCYRCYRSVVCLFVCLHVRALCSNGRRYRHDFFCIRQPHISSRGLNLTYIGQPFPPQILLIWTSVTFNGKLLPSTEWLDIRQWSQWRAYMKPPSLFWMVRTTSPKMGPQMHHTGPTSRRVLPPDECDRRYRQGSCVLCWMSLWAKRCRLLPNYLPLLLIVTVCTM